MPMLLRRRFYMNEKELKTYFRKCPYYADRRLHYRKKSFLDRSLFGQSLSMVGETFRSVFMYMSFFILYLASWIGSLIRWTIRRIGFGFLGVALFVYVYFTEGTKGFIGAGAVVLIADGLMLLLLFIRSVTGMSFRWTDILDLCHDRYEWCFSPDDDWKRAIYTPELDKNKDREEEDRLAVEAFKKSPNYKFPDHPEYAFFPDRNSEDAFVVRLADSPFDDDEDFSSFCDEYADMDDDFLKDALEK